MFLIEQNYSELWTEKVPDLTHVGAILPTLGLDLTTQGRIHRYDAHLLGDVVVDDLDDQGNDGGEQSEEEEEDSDSHVLQCDGVDWESCHEASWRGEKREI